MDGDGYIHATAKLTPAFHAACREAGQAEDPPLGQLAHMVRVLLAAYIYGLVPDIRTLERQIVAHNERHKADAKNVINVNPTVNSKGANNVPSVSITTNVADEVKKRCVEKLRNEGPAIASMSSLMRRFLELYAAGEIPLLSTLTDDSEEESEEGGEIAKPETTKLAKPAPEEEVSQTEIAKRTIAEFLAVLEKVEPIVNEAEPILSTMSRQELTLMNWVFYRIYQEASSK